jgi:hypothetical protein
MTASVDSVLTGDGGGQRSDIAATETTPGALISAIRACRTPSIVRVRLQSCLPHETVEVLTLDLPDIPDETARLLIQRAVQFGISAESLTFILEQTGSVEENETPGAGALILDDVRSFVRKFCAFPDEHCLVAVTLWAAHTHLVHHFHATPRLALLSPEAASGKTRVLEILDLLVSESLLALNVSPAAVFRTLSQKQVTLLFDEVDAIWSKRGKDDNHEDLRALLNAGYKKGATIPRCVGPKHDVINFPVFGAVALAGLGDLPDTIMSRAVIVRMRRRAPTEFVEPFRTRLHEPVGHKLRGSLARWAAVVGEGVGAAWPELPHGITDRPAECWEPLVATADAAGGEWPVLARVACTALCSVAADRRASLGIRLLADLKIIFRDAIAMHSETIRECLINGEGLDDDAPWGDLHGKPITKRAIASILSQYGVKPQKVKLNGCAFQGYRREHLWDAWVRYLPPSAPAQTEPSEQLEPKPPATDLAVPEVPHVPVP